MEDKYIRAVIQHESGGDSLAINPDDPSYGLGQVMPKWWRYSFVSECGSEATPESLMRPNINICYTTHILALLWERHDGNINDVLSAYNTGRPGAGRQYAAKVRDLIPLSMD